MDCVDYGVGFIAGIFHVPQLSAALYQRGSSQFGDAIGDGGRAILGMAWDWGATLSDDDGRHRSCISGAWFSHYPYAMVYHRPDKHRLDINCNK